VVHTFGWYIRKFVIDTKAKGANPIVLSPTVRNIWQDGNVERGTGSGRFGKWSQQVADAEKVPFLDATNIIADAYEIMGQTQIIPLFPVDHTHTGQAGADLNASFIVAGLKGMRSPLAQLLSDKGAAVVAAPNLARLHLPEPANPKLPAIFLVGDSTVRNGGGDGGGGQWGWGEPLFDLFDADKVNVVNRAVGGLSSRTFYTDVYWRRVLDMMKPGDFVLIQFGHNDGGSLDGPQGARVSLRGVGDETQGAVHTFGWYLKQFIAETRAKGATPIVCSLVPRKMWKDGKIDRNDEDFGKWAREVAESEKTPFLDLNEWIAREYDRLGAEQVEPLFADEHTHTSRQGAELNATIVARGLRALAEVPLDSYLKAR
jgi:lysophospholipase L1-like esterase